MSSGTGEKPKKAKKWRCPLCKGDVLRIKDWSTHWIVKTYTLVCETCGHTFRRRRRKK